MRNLPPPASLVLIPDEYDGKPTYDNGLRGVFHWIGWSDKDGCFYIADTDQGDVWGLSDAEAALVQPWPPAADNQFPDTLGFPPGTDMVEACHIACDRDGKLTWTRKEEPRPYYDKDAVDSLRLAMESMHTAAAKVENRSIYRTSVDAKWIDEASYLDLDRLDSLRVALASMPPRQPSASAHTAAEAYLKMIATGKLDPIPNADDSLRSAYDRSQWAEDDHEDFGDHHATILGVDYKTRYVSMTFEPKVISTDPQAKVYVWTDVGAKPKQDETPASEPPDPSASLSYDEWSRQHKWGGK